MAALCLVVCPTAWGAAERWWNTNWACRKTVQVTPAGTWKENPAAAVTFTTGGRMKPDAADLRIVDETGGRVPYYIIAAGFDDTCTVAFPVERPGQKLYLYYDNPNANSPGHDWVPERGLIIEVRTLGRGSIANWRSMRTLVKGSPKVQGRALHPHIFDGHNRFGPSDKYISIYRGYLDCPQSGRYGFATTSDDASFLLIDSKMVVQWPGKHNAVADARHNKTISLQRGVHLLEYYHAELTDKQVAEAAWRMPGRKDYTVIPSSAFVPFWQGRVTDYDQRRDSSPIDFSFVQESSVPTEHTLLSAVRFRITFSAARDNVEWSFGDGVTSTARSPVHVYMGPGKYRVRLKIGNKQVTNAVRVWDNERVNDNVPDAIAGFYLNIVNSYTLPLMSVEDVLTISRFAREHRAFDLEEKACDCLKVRRESYNNADVGSEFLVRATALWRADRSTEAIDLLDRVATGQSQNRIAMTALHRKGQYLLALGRDAQARLMFRQLDSRIAGQADLKAAALAGMGDYYRFNGDATKSAEYYRQAQDIAKDLPAGEHLAAGAYSQAVLEYLRADRADAALEQIDRWERAVPTDKLDGYLSALKSITMFKVGDGAMAYAEARDQYTVNPEGNYAPHALLFQGDYLALSDRIEEARQMYLTLADRYPESPLVTVARYRAKTPPKRIGQIKFPILDF